jgi:hypothetical protein
MADTSVTVGELFSLPDTRRPVEPPQGEAASRYQKYKERVVEEIKGIRWPAAMPDLVQKTAELFDIQVPGLMLAAWKKTDEIKQALEQSRESPQETSSVDLSDHTISTELHPKIEVRLKQALVKTLEFTVTLSLTLKTVSLGIRNGAIFEISIGSCVGGGKIEYDDLVIAEKELKPVPLLGVLRLQDTQVREQ